MDAPWPGTAWLGTLSDPGKHHCPGSPAPVGDGMEGWGMGQDSEDKEETMETLMGIRRRYWGPRGDSGDQEGMMETKR